MIADKRIISLMLVLLMAACHTTKNFTSVDRSGFNDLESGFMTPPDSIQTSVYWYWMSDNISKAGVIKDLQAMKSVGINRAFIGNIGHSSTPYGKVKVFSDEWWDILHTALKTATDLNIEIGIFNSPGWSQSGGPWIKPEQAMRYLASSEIVVTGPKKINLKLKKPAVQFQDVRVIAFKAPLLYGSSIADEKPTITSSTALNNLQLLFDKDTATSVVIPASKQFTINIETSNSYIARNITIVPGHEDMGATVELFADDNGVLRSLKTFEVDRQNISLHVGFDRFAPVSIAIPATTSKKFRIVFSKATPKFAVAELQISSSPRLERYSEKTLAKMFPAPLPYWKEYQWPQQPTVADNSLIIDPKSVMNISDNMDTDGTLYWDVPAGDWIVMRMGMTPTGVTNSPASPEATGLEVDKMSSDHVASHFDAFLGEIMRRIPPQDRKTWKVTVQDSYETGGQNWTDGMIEKFEKNYGYDPLSYLPTLKGKVIGSPEMSDRFLWDLRRFIADKVAYEFVAGLREVSHQYGLHTWLENYGHWGFPGEFLQYGGQSDEIAGEFWSEGQLGDIENRAASSAAHIYGKVKVSSESFTAGGKAFMRYPALMKQRGDRFFTEGINNTLLHLYIHQPDDRKPGINAGFGNAFNRSNTWFRFLDLFIIYLKRCNFLLQQGNYVADVAYFIGEDAPKMTGVTDPALPAGYSFDYINAEVIKTITKVENGRIYLADGMNYGLLVLPKLETMRPELLQKISELVAAGATILGPAPSRSPSLENYPQSDEKVKAYARALWGDINGNSKKANQFGKGLVLSGMDMQSALDRLQISPDFKANRDSVLFIHRSARTADIYFISNQSERTISFQPAFRVMGKQPWFWDATDGSMRQLQEFTPGKNNTTVDIKLAGLQSGFIVFRDVNQTSVSINSTVNFPEPSSAQPITSPWIVQFDTSMRGPLKPVEFRELIDWTLRPEEAIRYYSGTATYINTINLDKVSAGEKVLLDLGVARVMAKVKINGRYTGGAWTEPWQIDITKFVKKGENKIEIDVVNTWVNRLIGDSRLQVDQRKTFTNVNPYKPRSPLEPSGLLGPVKVLRVRY